MSQETLLQNVQDIQRIIIEHSHTAEVERQLHSSVYAAMERAGLFGMLAPKRFGGLEIEPRICLTIWEAVARIDGSAAWNLIMNQGIAQYAAWLPERGVKELFAGGIPTVAGAFHPQATARRVDGGWRVTGQVSFGSGCHHVQWLAMPAMEPDGTAPFAVFFPRSSGTILDT